MVASTDPRVAVGGVEERFYLDWGEVRDGRSVAAFLGDREDLLDERGVGWLAVGGVSEHRSDCCQAVVAGSYGVVAVVFEVVQEAAISVASRSARSSCDGVLPVRVWA